MRNQKVIILMRGGIPGADWIIGDSAGNSYLFSQCSGNSGIEKDLKNGWIIKHIWEDSRVTNILLERIGDY